MPVYNGERWIRQAIESILGQTYSGLELAICDNASTDATEDICREYVERDKRVRYYRNAKNIGLNSNYSLAFRRSSGKYFKWASCNDICAPQLIESCTRQLEADADVVLCYSRTRILRADGDPTESYDDNLSSNEAHACERMKYVLEHVRLNNAINGVIRADVLARTDLIGDYFSSDVVLLVELALHGKFFQVPEDLFFRRMTAGAATKLQSDRELVAYYQSTLRQPMLFQHWKLNRGYFAAATRAPLAVRERACVYGHLLRRALWDKRDLVKDLQLALRTTFRSKGSV